MITLIIAGAIIGFIVGVTGVGGGSLMTPFLLWYGIPAHVAVGTDLLYAAMTKTGGIVAHTRQGHVRWQAVTALALTSIPTSILTLLILKFYFPSADHYEGIIKGSLGVMLLVTGVLLLYKAFRHRPSSVEHQEAPISKSALIKLAIVGAPLGFLVTMSSVGAGVVGTMILLYVLPHFRSQHIVGTDLAHAVPLTFVAGIGHFLLLNNVDWQLLASLLIGSVPAVYLGSHWSRHIPDMVLRFGLAICLTGIGGYYLYVPVSGFLQSI